MNRNVVNVNSDTSLNFEVSQSETLKKNDQSEAFYQSARLSVSILNVADNEWEHLTSFETSSMDQLPGVEEIAKDISTSLHYKLAYSAVNTEHMGQIAQHALSLLSQEHQHLSKEPIPENKVVRQTRVIEQLIR
jgi:hypothetical protein